MTSREDNKRLAEAYTEAMGIGGQKLHDKRTDDPESSPTTTPAARIRYAPTATPTAMDTLRARRRAYFEVRNWHPRQHAPSCGCNP